VTPRIVLISEACRAVIAIGKSGRLCHDAIAVLDLSAIRDLLVYATIVAAITVSRKGADLPTGTDVAASLYSCLTG
jgi:fructokinase